MKKIRENLYRMHIPRDYNCRWVQSRNIHTYGYELKVFPATVVAGDKFLHQEATATWCKVKEVNCVPTENEG